MATSRVRDYAYYAHRREVDSRRRAQDARDAALHARFDAQAGEYRAKFERAHFAVVGEGARSAQENYRLGYERIFKPTGESRLGVTGGDAGNEADA